MVDDDSNEEEGLQEVIHTVPQWDLRTRASKLQVLTRQCMKLAFYQKLINKLGNK